MQQVKASLSGREGWGEGGREGGREGGEGRREGGREGGNQIYLADFWTLKGAQSRASLHSVEEHTTDRMIRLHLVLQHEREDGQT
jgi:hypothetical protein